MGRPKSDVEVMGTQKEALRRGIQFYRGRPCLSKHKPSIRYSKTGCCVECVQEYIALQSVKGLKEHDKVNAKKDLQNKVKEVWDE